MIGSFSTQVRLAHLLLVLLLPVYVNLVKELFLLALFHVVSGTVFPKASAKILLFSDMAKFFREYFSKIVPFHGLDDRNQGKIAIFGEYELIIAKMRGKTNSAQGKRSNVENEKQKERKEKASNPLTFQRGEYVNNSQQQQDDG